MVSSDGMVGMSENLKKFGKYFLLDKIAQGGMAEIFRARMAFSQGGSRILAIKKVIASYSENEDFVSMFKSEIKTTSGLTHPNIVQVYDYGDENQSLYIAMEWIDGKNLRQVLGRLQERKQLLPIDLAIWVVEQAALGLSYAHHYKDKLMGTNLNIVHRDISPQNILISYDGTVKIIDFGIAKAITNIESTRAGVIKGKPSYLSPEQISGDTLDGRSDLFALGVVFWELLTGRKLFQGDNDYAILKLIETCEQSVKPPSAYNPAINPDLDAIVLKCLKRNRDHRYAGTDELQRALHKFLYQNYTDFNPTNLSEYTKDLFKLEIIEDRKRLGFLNEKAEKLLAELPPTKKPELEDETRTLLTAPPLNQTETVKKEKSVTVDQSLKPKLQQLQSPKEESGITLDFEKTPVQDHKSRTWEYYNQTTTSLNKTSRLKKPQYYSVGGIAAVVLAIGAYWLFIKPSDTRVQRSLASAPAAQQAKWQENTEFGQLLIKAGDITEATVFLDGEEIAQKLPFHIKNLSPSNKYILKVTSNGYQAFEQEIMLSAGEKKILNLQMAREADPVSHSKGKLEEVQLKPNVNLQVLVEPVGLGTKIQINEQMVDASGIAQVPVDTPLKVKVSRKGYRTIFQHVTLHSDQLPVDGVATVKVQLVPADFGTLSITASPPSSSTTVTIVVDGEELVWNLSASSITQIPLPAGEYTLLFNSPTFADKKVQVVIQGGNKIQSLDVKLDSKQ